MFQRYPKSSPKNKVNSSRPIPAINYGIDFIKTRKPDLKKDLYENPCADPGGKKIRNGWGGKNKGARIYPISFNQVNLLIGELFSENPISQVQFGVD